MDNSKLFSDYLQTGFDGFVWATQQTPIARQNEQPPKGLGEWSVLRQVFHMQYYEQTCPLPSMRQWLGAPLPDMSDVDDDREWLQNTRGLAELIESFREVRAQQIALLTQFSPTIWDETRETIWGNVSLLWVVSKTWQHTNEHTSNIMRIALFWDMFSEENAQSEHEAATSAGNR